MMCSTLNKLMNLTMIQIPKLHQTLYNQASMVLYNVIIEEKINFRGIFNRRY